MEQNLSSPLTPGLAASKHLSRVLDPRLCLRAFKLHTHGRPLEAYEILKNLCGNLSRHKFHNQGDLKSFVLFLKLKLEIENEPIDPWEFMRASCLGDVLPAELIWTWYVHLSILGI